MLASWIKSIILFAIFASFVRYLLPDDKYLKYFKNTIGLIMILVVINPITELFNLNDKLQFDYYNECLSEQVYAQNDTYYCNLMGQLIEEYIEEQYKIEAFVNVESRESEVISVDINMSGENYEKINPEELKNDLSISFKLDTGTVNIEESAFYEYNK